MKTDAEREPLSMRWRADAVLIGVTIVWGADFVLVKNLLAVVPPLPFLFWRFAFAVVLCALFLPGRARTPGLVADGLYLGAPARAWAWRFRSWARPRPRPPTRPS